MPPVFLAEGQADGMGRATVGTFAAQDALTVAHIVLLHHIGNLQAHRALPGAPSTADTTSRLRLQVKRGERQSLLEMGAQHHKGRHPADGNAHPPSPGKQSQGGNQRYDGKISGESGDAGSGNPVVGHVEKINRMKSPGCGESSNNARYPRRPESIFDPPDSSSFDPFIHCKPAGLLQAAPGTDPAAKSAPKNQRRKKQSRKNDKAAGYNPRCASLNN